MLSGFLQSHDITIRLEPDKAMMDVTEHQTMLDETSTATVRFVSAITGKSISWPPQRLTIFVTDGILQAKLSDMTASTNVTAPKSLFGHNLQRHQETAMPVFLAQDPLPCSELGHRVKYGCLDDSARLLN